MPIGIGAGLAISGGLGAAASIGGAVLGGNAQAKMAQAAADMQMGMFQASKQLQMPFIQGGTDALAVLQRLTGSGRGGNPQNAFLTKMFNPSPSNLAHTPGYQFLKQQGLHATQNAMAAQGLGVSGPGMKAAGTFASGLADATWQARLKEDMAQKMQIFNMLFGQVQMGAQTAGNVGNQSQAAAQGIGQSLQNVGTTQGAMYNSMGQSINNALNTGMGSYLNYQIASQYPGMQGRLPQTFEMFGVKNPNYPAKA